VDDRESATTDQTPKKRASRRSRCRRHRPAACFPQRPGRFDSAKAIWSRPAAGGHRISLIGTDEGPAWKWKPHLEGGPSSPGRNQCRCPSVIQARDGASHLTYSYFVESGMRIKHMRPNEERIKTGD